VDVRIDQGGQLGRALEGAVEPKPQLADDVEVGAVSGHGDELVERAELAPAGRRDDSAVDR
jgi:hypothetical protein